jgi:protein PsiE
VQYLIYITITGLSRHLVIDVQDVNTEFHMYLLLSISGAIVMLSLAILILTYSEKTAAVGGGNAATPKRRRGDKSEQE